MFWVGLLVIAGFCVWSLERAFGVRAKAIEQELSGIHDTLKEIRDDLGRRE